MGETRWLCCHPFTCWDLGRAAGGSHAQRVEPQGTRPVTALGHTGVGIHVILSVDLWRTGAGRTLNLGLWLPRSLQVDWLSGAPRGPPQRPRRGRVGRGVTSPPALVLPLATGVGSTGFCPRAQRGAVPAVSGVVGLRPLRRKGHENWPHGLRNAGVHGGVPELPRVAQVLRAPRGVARKRVGVRGLRAPRGEPAVGPGCVDLGRGSRLRLIADLERTLNFLRLKLESLWGL